VQAYEGISGRIDQGARLLFNLKPNGDYLTVRANPLENNLVLWKFEKGSALVGEMDPEHAASKARTARSAVRIAGTSSKAFGRQSLSRVHADRVRLRTRRPVVQVG
jgi:hypothetical protein